MSGLKILGVLLIAPGAISLATTTYLVQLTTTYNSPIQNYVQLAGFAAIAIGVTLWKLGSSKRG